MSSVTWQGNRLIQNAGDHVEELGYVSLDQNTNTYVLWLKDTCNVFGLNGGYLRGDEFPSLASAKHNAAFSTSANLVHHMWMIKLGRESKKERKHVLEWIDERLASGDILTKSSFLSYMDNKAKMDRKFDVFNMVLGVILGILATLIYEHSGIWLKWIER